MSSMILSRPVVLTVFVVGACASVPPRAETPPPAAHATPAATTEPVRSGYTPADVTFMQGMIRHHAQAVLMAAWAPTHGASAELRTLAGRIDVSQKDEIALMTRWLRERNESVPEPEPAHPMHGGMLMPGMLTADQLADLDAARGVEFDRRFLAFMIYHHQGAVAMVEDLFHSPGGGQEDVIFRFASDVHADQLFEIQRMSQMLENLPATGGN